MTKIVVCFISVPHFFCMILLSLKSVGEFTHLNGVFIGMACIHYSHVDLPFIFCPEATRLLAGGPSQMQEADGTGV